MLKVAMTNQKGGVGKTTTALGMASAARAAGLRVLVIDADPQANATTALGPVEPDDGPVFDTFDVLTANAAGAIAGAMLPTEWGPEVSVVGSSLSLQEAEQDTSIGSEFRLRKGMEGLDGFDLVLIDCPPSVGRLTINALIAADVVLVVTEPSAPALQGVQHVEQSLDIVREHYNPQLKFGGIIVNKLVGGNANEPRLRLDELIDVFGRRVWEPFVPTRTVIAEAMGAQAPIHDYPPSRASDAREAYDGLLERLLQVRPARRQAKKGA